MDREGRRQMLDGLAQLNEIQYADVGAPEIKARIAKYELAFRMKMSVSELMDLSN